MFYRFCPPLDKFNLLMPEQSYYDVIRALTHGVVIGVARVSTSGDKTIFASPPTKTAEFEVQNRARAKARKR